MNTLVIALICFKNRDSNANIFRYINSMKQNNITSNYETNEFMNPMQVFDYCKEVLSKFISGLFQSAHNIPYVIK